MPPLAMAATNPGHMTPSLSPLESIRQTEADPSEETLSGNTVNLEQQMINLGDANRGYTMNSDIRRVFHQLLLSALK